MDLSGVTASITAAITDVTSLGLACLSVYVAVKAFGWVRSAMK
ncbi:major capsid protein [Cellvibrio sp. QJXJ]|nr:major capsid protein [Cellvibrio sp. QJXJ]UUA71126.1 major capsid protein [Cellvibrio sp. QJXJ]